jgi:hypothetical protein
MNSVFVNKGKEMFLTSESSADNTMLGISEMFSKYLLQGSKFAERTLRLGKKLPKLESLYLRVMLFS